MDLRKVFSKNLNHLMETRGVRQADLMRLLRRPSGTVNSWTAGQKVPRAETLVDLAAVFGVAPGYFFDENPDLHSPIIPDDPLWGLSPENRETAIKFIDFLRANQKAK